MDSSALIAAGGGVAHSDQATPGSSSASSSNRKCSVCKEIGHDKRRHTGSALPSPASLEDRYTDDILRQRFSAFRSFYTSGIPLRDELGIRLPNMPEDVSENLIKVIIRNHLGVESYWARHVKKPGDLWSPTEKVIESKCFMSDGPCSFGPDKIWSVIYFLDLRKWIEDEIAVYRCTLTPNDEAWQNIQMSHTETWKNQVAVGRRPHIGWELLYPQIKDHCTEVYRGSFEGIFTAPASAPADQQSV